MVTERTLESVTGERMVIQESTPDVLRFERHLLPRQRPVPKVAHPTQEAHLKVLEGRLHATVGGKTRDYGAGESLTVPAGTFHSAWNVDAQPARVLVEFSPAEGILGFFEEMMGLTSMNLLGIAWVVKHHREAVRLAAPYAQIVGLLGLFVR
jgi:quercetin dioxygenase-like cupin family protein